MLLHFQINDVACRLDLPSTWTIHNVFHVSLLKLFHGEPPTDLPDEEQLEVAEENEVLVPEQSRSQQDHKVKGRIARRYRVKFKNFSTLDAQWMEKDELTDSPLVLQLYLEAFGLQPTLEVGSGLVVKLPRVVPVA